MEEEIDGGRREVGELKEEEKVLEVEKEACRGRKMWRRWNEEEV